MAEDDEQSNDKKPAKRRFKKNFAVGSTRFQKTEQSLSDEQLRIEKEYLNKNQNNEEREVMDDDLGRQFIRAAREFDNRAMQKLLEQGAPINYQDQSTGATALHFVASAGDREALRVLLKNRECNYLIEDNQGRRASNFAINPGGDSAIARLLSMKEKQQQILSAELHPNG